MRFDKNSLVTATVLMVSLCCVLSYFVKPKAPALELVSPKQELPNFSAKYPGDTTLANRVMKSYGLAMILVQSPYTQRNVISIENVRSWARDRFQAHPDFLHPVSIGGRTEKNDTVFGAIGYNLFAGLHYWLQERAGEVLSWRIKQFHGSYAYQSFNLAFFDLFGRDAETATLLARYQTERGRLAVNVVLWSAVWLLYGVAACVWLTAPSRLRRWERWRLVLGGVWLIAATSYFVAAWMNNELSTFLAAVGSLTAALYTLFPTIIARHKEAEPSLVRIEMTPAGIAFATWITISLLAVQVVTWIRAGHPDFPDPVTLLLSSLTGNFIHDPVNAKRMVLTLIGIPWVVLGWWTISQQRKNKPASQHQDEPFESLKTTYALEEK